MSTTKWVLDPAHSEIQFKVKHLLISTVSGDFKKFEASAKTEGDDFTTAKVQFSADIDSISTNNEQRDAHLKNGDFFDAENHPKLSFVSDKMVKVDNEVYELHGQLTMRGVTKDVTLKAEFGGSTTDPWGNTRVGFEISGKIDRTDFGVSFGMISETGGLLLGNDVKLFANTEFVKQQVAELV
jgi:polyisoprenoid-binding protein YceI